MARAARSALVAQLHRLAQRQAALVAEVLRDEEFVVGTVSEVRGRCGKPGGCRMIRCPRCFYENPQETAVVKSLKKLFGNKEDDKGAKE